MAHGHGQQGGDGLGVGGGLGRGQLRGKNWDNCNRTTINYLIKINLLAEKTKEMLPCRLANLYFSALKHVTQSGADKGFLSLVQSLPPTAPHSASSASSVPPPAAFPQLAAFQDALSWT